jgi:hypothetical protein
MGNLLRDGSMLALCPSLELPVETVGKIFDVEDCHMILLNSSIMEEHSFHRQAMPSLVGS